MSESEQLDIEKVLADAAEEYGGLVVHIYPDGSCQVLVMDRGRDIAEGSSLEDAAVHLDQITRRSP